MSTVAYERSGCLEFASFEKKCSETCKNRFGYTQKCLTDTLKSHRVFANVSELTPPITVFTALCDISRDSVDDGVDDLFRFHSSLVKRVVE